MDVNLLDKDIESLQKTPVLPQTPYWAKVKDQQGYEPRAFHLSLKDEYIKEKKSKDLLVVIRQVGKNHTIAYIPYGPVIEPQEELQGKFLEELSETLRVFLPNNCIFIRYDLLWQSPWQKDESRYTANHIWTGPPEPRIQEMRMNFDTEKWNLRKASTDILPANTLFINLQSDTDFLLNKMKPKTRYNIRLSLRKGVGVHQISFEKLPLWYSMYKETALRNGLHLHDISYFKALLKAQHQQVQPSTKVYLLMATKDEQPLAGMVLAITGGRATYLYGASSSNNRNLMGTYALQWKAMQLAQQHGCKEYDMFGISPSPDPSHPMCGLYRFKKGFGGYEYFRQGCWDYPLDEASYDVYRSVELNGQGYYSK